MRLQDFAKFRDVALVQPTRAKLIVPAFVLPASIWTGASLVLAEFAFGNSFWFSVKLPIKKFGTSFIAAIRYYDADNDVIVRYKLWDDDDAVLFFPVYAGERLGLNAILEIWSLDLTTLPTLAADKTLYSSVFAFPPNMSCSACCTIPDAQVLLAQIAPSVLPPYAACNPWCDGMCTP